MAGCICQCSAQARSVLLGTTRAKLSILQAANQSLNRPWMMVLSVSCEVARQFRVTVRESGGLRAWCFPFVLLDVNQAAQVFLVDQVSNHGSQPDGWRMFVGARGRMLHHGLSSSQRNSCHEHTARSNNAAPILVCSILDQPKPGSPQGSSLLLKGRGPRRFPGVVRAQLRAADQVSQGGPHSIATMLPEEAALHKRSQVAC